MSEKPNLQWLEQVADQTEDSQLHLELQKLIHFARQLESDNAALLRSLDVLWLNRLISGIIRDISQIPADDDDDEEELDDLEVETVDLESSATEIAKRIAGEIHRKLTGLKPHPGEDLLQQWKQDKQDAAVMADWIIANREKDYTVVAKLGNRPERIAEKWTTLRYGEEEDEDWSL